MTTLSIKIVGVEGDSVLVKYATDASAKSIDEYDAVAFQPKELGCTTVDDFLNRIKDRLIMSALIRDKMEQVADIEVDFTSWNGATAEHSVYLPENVAAGQTISPAIQNPEVIL